MANPELVKIPCGQWTLVARGVKKVYIHRVHTDFNYFQTYRDRNEDPPVHTSDRRVPEEAVPVFVESDQEDLDFQRPVDVYFFCRCRSREAGGEGEVRVDIP